ncbi:MAG: CpaF family protein [Candidatus Woesearchaeota archaeon]|nr:MAG: CpaF family protein [Candidatus Woesearchaeota archaeon]
MEEVIDKYKVEADGVIVNVSITGGKGTIKKYKVTLLSFSEPTLALLDQVRQELITEVGISTNEILDPNSIDKIKEKFKEKAFAVLTKYLPKIPEETKNYLTGRLLQEMLGLGTIEFLLNDLNLEEVVINSIGEAVRVYHKVYGWLETNVNVENEAQIQNYANVIARRVGRQINTLNPLLDAHLVTGDRANAVLFPISKKGNTITIRKFARDPWTVTDFIKNNTVTTEVMALIWLATQYELNVLISGGTASGKTSFLNACLPFIPPNHRVITIEDTSELQLPPYLYWTPLITRLPNPEGKGEVSMQDLLINSLRMRPDRIVLGEIRRKNDAQVLFEAMHTGHSVYATVHADTIADTITRLVNPPIEVAENLLEAVSLNVVMFRDRRLGIRRTYQVGEYLAKGELKGGTITPNILYRWKADVDKIVEHSKSLRLFEELNRTTGMSLSEMKKDLETKQKILEWMVKNGVRQVNDVGKVIHDYYLDPDWVIKVVTQNKKPEELLK